MKTNLNNNNSSYITQTYKEEYKSFSPGLINRSFEWKDKQINILLETAIHQLGELNAFTQLFPNLDRHIPMFIAREVVASNHMERINSHLSEAFLSPLNPGEKQENTWQELRNYIKAITWGVNELKRFPLSIRLVKQTHKILFSNLPQEYETAGKMRTSPPLDKYKMAENTNYTPPNKHEIRRLIDDGRRFWRNDSLQLPQLIKMAISLYQFENILPFLNGNGRTARTLMILELISLNYLSKPIFNLSSYFERNRMEYYHNLNLIRSQNDIEQWIKFFITGIRETAQESKEILLQIQNLNNSYIKRINSQLGKKRHKNAYSLLNILYSNPYITVNQTAEKLNISFQSANLLIKEIEKIDMIREIYGIKRNRIYSLWEYAIQFEK